MDRALTEAGAEGGLHDTNQDTGERWDDRTRRLLGDDAVARLEAARVLVVGVGGVGGYAAEMLARSGIGHLTLVDADCVATSNINRQLIASADTVGESKVVLFAERFHKINPKAEINALHMYLEPDNVEELLSEGFDYVIDAIDTVAPKVSLLSHCLISHIPVVSSMGAGGRTDPTKIGYMDIWETRDDGLAKAVRSRLRKAGVRGRMTVVGSTEPPQSHSLLEMESANKRSSYGTLATIPAIFGIMLANKVIVDLAKTDINNYEQIQL